MITLETLITMRAKLMTICTHGQGWWNLKSSVAICSAPAMQAMWRRPCDVKCLESDSLSAIYTIYILKTVNAMVN